MHRPSALIISGSLGSGKTTLVRGLLADARQRGERAAFISNELGELGIDQALLAADGGAEAFVELEGGCVCCRLNDALYDTLLRLRDEVDPERIIIETSGAAVPQDVQLTFFQPPLRDWICEEAIVTVVDAERLAAGDRGDEVFVEQIEGADLIVLHKIDLLADAALQVPALTGRLQGLNPGVGVVAASRGAVDPRLLLGSLGPLAPSAPRERGHSHAHLHAGLVTEVVAVAAGQSVAALEAWALGLGALRVKGFVEAEGGARCVVQGVGRRAEVAAVRSPSAVPEGLWGRVVVIRRRGG